MFHTKNVKNPKLYLLQKIKYNNNKKHSNEGNSKQGGQTRRVQQKTLRIAQTASGGIQIEEEFHQKQLKQQLGKHLNECRRKKIL